jgi:predicted  nucleic acid-binding Zn-ribbon protein
MGVVMPTEDYKIKKLHEIINRLETLQIHLQERMDELREQVQKTREEIMAELIKKKSDGIG